VLGSDDVGLGDWAIGELVGRDYLNEMFRTGTPNLDLKLPGTNSLEVVSIGVVALVGRYSIHHYSIHHHNR
jgi:hypothetical protein